MAAVTLNAQAPARGAFRPAQANGHHRTSSGTFAFDNSYPTGGESIADIFTQFRNCQGIIFASRSGYVFDVDYTNRKVLAYYADNNAAADSALIQVPDTTDLSAVTGVRWFAWGE